MAGPNSQPCRLEGDEASTIPLNVAGMLPALTGVFCSGPHPWQGSASGACESYIRPAKVTRDIYLVTKPIVVDLRLLALLSCTDGKPQNAKARTSTRTQSISSKCTI